MKPIRLAIVGVGKIARDQHIPAIRANPSFTLVATATPGDGVDGVVNFPSLDALLAADVAFDAISVCTPPQAHYELARLGLEKGKHVLLEKPPCPTTAEMTELIRIGAKSGRTLFQTWHSQHAAGIEPARQWLSTRTIRGAQVTWKEDVRRWHPGQTWIWQAGGFGVFDPGINAISILSRIIPQAFFVRTAELSVPSNCDSPIAAKVAFATDTGAPIAAEFDFRQTGAQTWDIEVQTDDGTLKLSEGGDVLAIDGKPVAVQGAGEYPDLYRRFAELVAQSASEVDIRPFELVADAFLLGRRVAVEPFVE